MQPLLVGRQRLVAVASALINGLEAVVRCAQSSSTQAKIVVRARRDMNCSPAACLNAPQVTVTITASVFQEILLMDAVATVATVGRDRVAAYARYSSMPLKTAVRAKWVTIRIQTAR